MFFVFNIIYKIYVFFSCLIKQGRCYIIYITLRSFKFICYLRNLYKYI